MKKLRRKLARAISEWGPYVGVLLVFAGFLAFVSWDLRQQQKARRAVGVAEARDGATPAEAGREGVAEELERERILRERREREAREAEEQRTRIRPDAPPHDAERSANIDVLLEGLDAPRFLALAPGIDAFYLAADGGKSVWRVEQGRMMRALDAETPIQQGRADRQPPLAVLADIALASRQQLYAVEAGSGGRLLHVHLDAEGRATHGEPVDVPGLWRDFEWSAMAAASDGRLLLGASNRERATRAPGGVLEVGVLLYRDVRGQWWILHERLSGPIESVAFSKSGEQAVYVCSTNGEVSWVDLRVTRPTGGTSAWRGRAPGSVAVLPNGALLVAEAAGVLWGIDPGTDHAQVLADALPPLNGAVWHESMGRILAIDREGGRLLSISLDPGFDASEDRMVFARYEPLFHLVHVPVRPPDYLAEVLALGGFRSRPWRPVTTSFRDFAQRVPLVSAEVVAVPEGDVADPIRYLQFVVFDTDRILNADPGPSTVLAAFHARTAGGQVIRTSALSLPEGDLPLPDAVASSPVTSEIIVPNAASMRLSAGGIATLDFLGYGQTPDFSITLDPLHADNSTMLVRHADGTEHRYRLQTPRRPGDQEGWVMAATYQLADAWKRLDPPMLVAGPGGGAQNP